MDYASRPELRSEALVGSFLRQSKLLPVVRVFFLFLIRPVDGGETSWLLPVAGDSDRNVSYATVSSVTLQQPGLLEARS